jgi:heat-inducible transcriptional repressor
VRHVELVALSTSRLLAVLILSTGRVEQRVIEVPVELSDELIADLRTRVNKSASGVQISEAAASLGDLPDEVSQERRSTYSIVVAALVEAMSDHKSDERVVVGGTANLARFGDSFEQSIRPMLEALEEHVVLLKLLGEATSPTEVTVRIGHEGPIDQLSSTSVVATGYGASQEALASLGIVGPTRMDYPGTMSAVRAVARYVSTILDEG